MDTIGAYLNGLVTAAQASLVLAIIVIGLMVGGGIWALGNRALGQSWIVGAFVGGGIMYGAQAIASALSTVAKVAPRP
jgi:hypothetical protein